MAPHSVFLASLYSAAGPVALIAGYVCATVEPLAQLCYAWLEVFWLLTGWQPHFSEQVY